MRTLCLRHRSSSASSTLLSSLSSPLSALLGGEVEEGEVEEGEGEEAAQEGLT
jgi:hypothetical protein